MTAHPDIQYRTIINDSGNSSYVNRLLVGTATTGLVRIEWVAARYGQLIPPNWSTVEMRQMLNAYIPLRYQVDDAQNLIVDHAIKNDFQWVLLIEHDNILPLDAFIRFNEYIRNASHPVVSGLYFTRSYPSEPLVYRGRGTSFYGDWQIGDKVWCDGVPTGCLLISVALLKAIWEDSEEYQAGKMFPRRVFNTPRDIWYDPGSEQFNTVNGTSDLDFCKRIIDGGYLEKSGWTDHARMAYPFLVDTNIFCGHIEPNGEIYPPQYHEIRKRLGELQASERKPPALGISVSDSAGVGDKVG